MSAYSALFDPDAYAKAWEFASYHHFGQHYGGRAKDLKVSYINHIGSVAMEIIAVLPGDPSLDGNLAVQCALLHDVVEDTSVTPRTIAKHFGEQVAEGVSALSKDPSIEDKNARMSDSLRRISKLGREVAMVKMADRITNLYHPPHYWDDDKVRSYQVEARSIHEALSSANEPLAARLHKKIQDYSQFLGRNSQEGAWFR